MAGWQSFSCADWLSYRCVVKYREQSLLSSKRLLLVGLCYVGIWCRGHRNE
jgi:hypothetical protein